MNSLLFVVGPPGSGKTTLTKEIEDACPRTSILNAGDCWRRIADSHSRHSSAVQVAISRGEAIPDRVFLLVHKLFFRNSRGCQFKIIDGNPFSLRQIDSIIKAYCTQIPHSPDTCAVVLDAENDECMRRMKARGRKNETAAQFRLRLKLYDQQQRVVINKAISTGVFSRSIRITGLHYSSRDIFGALGI